MTERKIESLSHGQLIVRKHLRDERKQEHSNTKESTEQRALRVMWETDSTKQKSRNQAEAARLAADY